jgi:CBS domain-containing protein
MKVGELMTKPAWTVRAETPLKLAAEIMAVQRVSGLPVVDADGRAVGVVSEADVLAKERPRRGRREPPEDAKANAVAAGEAMTAPAITVREEAPVEAGTALMTEYDVKRLPVVDGAGRVVGVVSRADLVRVAVL